MNIWNSIDGLSVFYIISQFFAFAAFIFDLIAIQRKKKSTLLNMDVMAAFCSFLHYAFLGAWSGMVSKFVTTIRNAIAASEASHKRKSPKILPIIFVIIYIVIGFFTFDSILAILPILAPCIYTIVIYTGDVKKIRYAALITGIIWLAYDICIFSILGSIAQAILLVNDMLAIYRYRNQKINNKLR